MKDVGRDDIECDLMEIERDLERLRPAAAPSGLRRLVLDQAREAHKSAALSPTMRIVSAACSTVIILVLGLDPLIVKYEAARLTAVLDGRQTSAPTSEALSELAEILACEGKGAVRMARLGIQAAPAVRGERERQAAEAWKRLKGWLEDETSKNLD